MNTMIFAAFLNRPVRIQSADGARGQPLRVESEGLQTIAADLRCKDQAVG